MKKMSYLDCRNILKYSNFWDDYYEKVGLFLIFLLRNHYNTIQKRICFFYINYIINLSNNDFKFAIKKLVDIYYNKIKYIGYRKQLSTFNQISFFSKIIIHFS